MAKEAKNGVDSVQRYSDALIIGTAISRDIDMWRTTGDAQDVDDVTECRVTKLARIGTQDSSG